MIPIIYPSNETEFLTRGYGALADCISCTVTEVLNGEYSLELRYPKKGIHAEYLQVRNIIMCKPSADVERQAFRIYRVNRSLQNSITVYAYQLAYDLSGYVAHPYRMGVTNDALNLRESVPSGTIIMTMPANTQLSILGSQEISGDLWYKVSLVSSPTTIGWCNSTYVTLSSYTDYPITVNSLAEAILLFNESSGDFVISTDKTSSADFTLDMPSSVRSWFGGKEGSLIDRYGGEWKFDIWNCQLLDHRGEDNGARISYGVNIAQYTKETADGVYSDVLPYYAKENEGGIKQVVVGSAISTGASFQRTLMLDISDKFDTKPTVAQVTAQGNLYVSSHNLASDSQTITIDPEVVSVDVNMGDTVHVYYEDEIVETRVIKTTWDVYADRYTKIELGTKKENIAQTIKKLR